MYKETVMKHVNRIVFDKLKLQWEIRKIASGVVHGDEAVGEIISGQSNRRELDNGLEAARDLFRQGWDIVFEDENGNLQSSDNISGVFDAFGNYRNQGPKEKLRAKMDELEELGRKLLQEEKYEEMQEAHEIWLKLKKEYDDFV